MIKRAFDCAAALAGLIVLAPLLAIVAVLIRLESPGPIVFRHERVGRRFRPFHVYKLRTMRTETGDAVGSRQSAVDDRLPDAGITFAGDRDPRITRIGRVLRRTKIDELPQLVNVLKGDMSLVGPRPEVAEYVARFRQDYESVLEVRPGMTDFASLAYRDEAALLARAADPAAEYAERILPDKIRLSKEYVRRSSMLVDIALILRTIGSLVIPSRRTSRFVTTMLLALSACVVTGRPVRPSSMRTIVPHVRTRPPIVLGRMIVCPCHVSPRGTERGKATAADPIDLATALSGKIAFEPGDIIWLHGGTYRGTFVSHLSGTPHAPIQVRAYPGERATIDGGATPQAAVLTVHGGDTWYRDFEITNSNADRTRERGIGVNVFGPRTRLINLVIHDTGNGIGLWTPAVDAELYGNVIYDVGWEENHLGKGHSIYVQNETGTKHLLDNVLFNGYSFGIHAYTEQGRIDNLHIEGNVAFNHGLLSSDRVGRANILVGGWRVATLPAIVGNLSYYDAADEGRGIELGHWAGCRAATVEDNYSAGGTPIEIRRCEDIVVSGNTFYGAVDADLAGEFPENTYRPSGSGVDVFVRPNAYERGRATIVVFNWPEQPSVAVDLSELRLEPGERVALRDVQDYFGPVVAQTAYAPGTPLVVPMTRMSTARPAGGATVPHTSAAFGVFLVEPLEADCR